MFSRAKGGAIRVANGTLTVSGSTFDGNVNLAGDGGAVDVANQHSSTIANCIFRNNVAKRNDKLSGFVGLAHRSLRRVEWSPFFSVVAVAAARHH